MRMETLILLNMSVSAKYIFKFSHQITTSTSLKQTKRKISHFFLLFLHLINPNDEWFTSNNKTMLNN
jgi:hypothetical protein